jgi:hypothetical protein
MPIVVTRSSVEAITPFDSVPSNPDEYYDRIYEVAGRLGIESKTIDVALLHMTKDTPVDEQAEQRRALGNYVLAQAQAEGGSTEDLLVASSLYLYWRLAEFNSALAEEGAEVADISRPASQEVSRVLGVEIERLPLWANSVGHDDGKVALGRKLTQHSQDGKPWTNEQFEAMKDHSVWGFVLSVAAGQSLMIARTKFANHAKQEGLTYGHEAFLDNPERLIRDLTAAYDTQLACVTRTNDRNKHLGLEERIKAARANIARLVDDYKVIDEFNNPTVLARVIAESGEDYIFANYDFTKDESGILRPSRRNMVVAQTA